MANRYWVGTGTWDGSNTANWSATSGGAGGASVPTSVDDVFFNASSGNCIMDATNTGAKSLNCTGYTGTMSSSGSPTFNIAGSVTFVSGMSWTSQALINITATATLTTAGKVINAVYITAPGGTVTLGDALTCGDGLILYNGTFSTSASNYSLSANYYVQFSPSGTKTINLNGSTVTLFGYSGWNPTNSTVTVNAGTSTINISSGNFSFYGAGQNYNKVTLGDGSSSNNITISNSGGTISQLTLTHFIGPNTGVASYILASNITVTTLITGSSGTPAGRLFFRSDTLGTARTITATTWSSLSDLDFRDITMNTTRSGTRLGDCGGNTNITFPAAKTVYYGNTAGGGITASNIWALSIGGATSANNFPLAQDTIVYPSAYPNSGQSTIIEYFYNLGTIDMSARTSNTLQFVTNINNTPIYGNFICASGVSFTVQGGIVFSGRGSQTITSAGRTYPNPITINCLGSVTLQDALTHDSASGFTVTSGTFNSNGFNISFSSTTPFTSSGSSTRTLTFGSSTWTLAGTGNVFTTASTGLSVTTNTGTVSLTAATAKTFAGGGVNFNGLTLNQGGAGELTISGANTFGNITNTYSATGATSIRFPGSTTTTFANWNASGAAGKLLTITSGGTHTLSKSSGIVSANYLSILNSTATGGATWYAGANSTNSGGNTGWIFSNAPSATANFLMFFM